MDLKVFKTKRKAEMIAELILSLLIAETGFIMLTRTGIPEFLALGFIGTGIYFAAETLVHDELQLARIHIYIDMDGCIARWAKALADELETKEFYESREMEKNLIEAVKILQRAGFHVTILTAYINEAAKEGKKNWLKEAGLEPSTSEAYRTIQGGGARINGEQITDKKFAVTLDCFKDGELILQKGKKKFKKIELA